MKNPGRERHHRERVIENRMRVIRDVFGGNWGLRNRGPGSLHKDHFTNCSCIACRNYVDGKRRTCKPAEWAWYEAEAHGFEWQADGLWWYPD